MTILKKPLFIVILIYLATRLINLTLLPVFSDEALYMEWGWRATHYPGQLFHSLLDAKQPFLMWFFGLGQSLFPDPLFGSRLVSVFTGFFSLVGLYQIGKKYFSHQIAVLSSILYLLIPNFLFYDRQALMESALVACCIWSVFFLLDLLQTSRMKSAILLGLCLGLGFFIKSSAAIFLVTSLIILVIEMFKNRFRLFSLSQISISILIVFLLVNASLFLQSQYWSTLHTNSRWTFTLSELLKFPLGQWIQNLVGNLELMFVHLTPPLFILMFVGLWLLHKSKFIYHKSLIYWFLISFSLYLLSLKFMNFMSFRYQTPLLALSPIIIAFALSKISNPILKSIFLLLPAVFSLLLLLSPITFFRLQNQLTRYSYIEGYVSGHDTGYQVNAIVHWLKNQHPDKPIFVGIGVHSFNPESGIWAYFRNNPLITITYMDQILFPPGSLTQIKCLASPIPTYFIAKLDDTVGLEKYLEKVTVITNPYNPDYSTVYTLKKDCQGFTATLDVSSPITH